jgi:hypothetical protein
MGDGWPGKPTECPSINGYFSQSLGYVQILILEILAYIPAVKIFACLGLEQNISFLDGHYLIWFSYRDSDVVFYIRIPVFFAWPIKLAAYNEIHSCSRIIEIPVPRPGFLFF